MDKIKPIYLEYEDGRKYTLEFTRKTVAYAEDHGFKLEEVPDKMMLRVPELFFYAFRMHHPTVTKETTDSILFDDLGGVTTDLASRLSDLYQVAYTTLFNESGDPKNSKVRVLM